MSQHAPTPTTLPISVLIVDDDAAMRALMRHHLERAGYHVIEAEDGRQALRRIRSGQADVVVLDIFMPVMDGIETVSALREGRSFRGKVLAVSGGGQLGSLDYLEHALTFGADGVLAKPFSGDQLRQAVSRLLDIPPPVGKA